MSGRVFIPDPNLTLANAVERIRILEAICCASGADPAGLQAALDIRERACSWYGLGDGGTETGDIAHNFRGGPDGVFNNDGDGIFVPTGAPPVGLDGYEAQLVPLPFWPISYDSASFASYGKEDSFPSTPQNNPYVATSDTISTAISFTVNLWAFWWFWTELHVTPFVATTFFGTGYYGFLTGGTNLPGANGFYIGINAETVEIDPITGKTKIPEPHLRAVLGDGTNFVNLDGGFPLTTPNFPVPDHLDPDVPGERLFIPHWTMVTVTFDADTQTMSLYVNGALTATGVYTGGEVSSSAPQIGSVNFGTGEASYATVHGFVDEVGLWCDEFLSSGEVLTLYNGGTPPPPRFVAGIPSEGTACGWPVTSDGVSHAVWGNPCRGDAPFVIPATATAQTITDALIALGLVTQAP